MISTTLGRPGCSPAQTKPSPLKNINTLAIRAVAVIPSLLFHQRVPVQNRNGGDRSFDIRYVALPDASCRRTVSHNLGDPT
jgi:hypothetical protein